MGEAGRPRFVPIRLVSSGRRLMLFTLGPLLWVVAIVTASFVAHQSQAILIALAILGGSMLFALVLLIPLRWLRVRDESER